MYNFSLMFQGAPEASRFDVRQTLYVVSANNTGGGEQVYDTEKLFTVITPCP